MTTVRLSQQARMSARRTAARCVSSRLLTTACFTEAGRGIKCVQSMLLATCLRNPAPPKAGRSVPAADRSPPPASVRLT